MTENVIIYVGGITDPAPETIPWQVMINVGEMSARSSVALEI